MIGCGCLYGVCLCEPGGYDGGPTIDIRYDGEDRVSTVTRVDGSTFEVRVPPAPTECTAVGCERPIAAMNLCGMHYQRSSRHGPSSVVTEPAATISITPPILNGTEHA